MINHPCKSAPVVKALVSKLKAEELLQVEAIRLATEAEVLPTTGRGENWVGQGKDTKQ